MRVDKPRSVPFWQKIDGKNLGRLICGVGIVVALITGHEGVAMLLAWGLL